MEEVKQTKRLHIGKVLKLSGWGSAYHERLLKLEDGILAYYRVVPRDFSGSSNHIQVSRD